MMVMVMMVMVMMMMMMMMMMTTMHVSLCVRFSGLAPHCLAILKTAHLLTEKLVGMTMGNAQQLTSPETITDLVSIAKRIGPRVDDVVRAMYPPLDPRLLEARSVTSSCC